MSESEVDVLSLTRNSDDLLAQAIDAQVVSSFNRPVAANGLETLVKVNPRLSHVVRNRNENMNQTM